MADPRGRFARATQLLQQAATASRSTRQALGTFTRLELLSRCKDAVLKSQPLVKRPLIEELEDSNGSETSSEASSGAASEAAATPQMMAPPASAAAAAATTTGSPAAAAASATEQRPLELRVQDLLLALLPEVVRRLRATIMQKGHTGSEAGFKPYTGPDTFDRALAARRLGWVVRQLGYTHLTPAIPAVLPSILAAVDDVSPPVQSLGLWTLHHLATEALPSDLRWQRELLLDVAKRSISGCDERVWPAAAPTATALAIALEGKDPYAAGYDLIMRGMLEEGERHAHVPARRIVWLRAIQPLLQALALVNVRYLGRLLPLLLQWLQEFDRPSRTGALQALHCVIQQTWPRIPAHADLLWQHLQWAHDREKGAPESAEQPAAVQWIERCAELLAWCSRDFVQQRLAAGDLERESLLRYGLAVEQ
ncbi:hypothetical protein WJX72_008564 [[Myrmecia] bisecta]|uniref:Uncharacterized protein n=1 Tax=[Myrmecia] bisecta TaxID=41462 RepID=A0AAW1P2Z8_9CHLO